MATSAQLRKQILQGSWDAALAALYGADPAVLQRQRGRYAAALEQFELYFGPGRQVQVYSAPGRAELGGNHTDHQGGYGLAAAVTLDMVAVAARNTDGYVRVKSRGFNKLDVIDLATAEPQAGESTHSASLIRGIAEGFRAVGKMCIRDRSTPCWAMCSLPRICRLTTRMRSGTSTAACAGCLNMQNR